MRIEFAFCEVSNSHFCRDGWACKLRCAITRKYAIAIAADVRNWISICQIDENQTKSNCSDWSGRGFGLFEEGVPGSNEWNTVTELQWSLRRKQRTEWLFYYKMLFLAFQLRKVMSKHFDRIFPEVYDPSNGCVSIIVYRSESSDAVYRSAFI